MTSCSRFGTQPWSAPRKNEAALQAMIETEGGDFELKPWDWFYYTEKVRKAKFDIDEESVKPYFTLAKVKESAFRVANRLWGVTFTPLNDVPTYHPDVEVYEVKDADGQHLGVFMFDFFARQDKRGGAWMNSFRVQSKVAGDVRAIVVNNCNFAKERRGDADASEFRAMLERFFTSLVTVCMEYFQTSPSNYCRARLDHEITQSFPRK